MTDFTAFLTDGSVANFMLLLMRFGSLFIFMPFFSSPTFLATVKSGIAFYLTIIFYPMMPPVAFEVTITNLLPAILSEVFFGALAGLLLGMVFATMQYAGELISFVMGFSMATTMDPQAGVSSPVISQFLNMFAIMVFILADGHHTIIHFMHDSVISLPIGGFIFSENAIKYILDSMASLFIVGFSIAFPIIALSILSDIIFGMIMKTMPSFNLLVIGFPIKITIGFIVLVAVLTSIVVVFKNILADAFKVVFGLY